MLQCFCLQNSFFVFVAMMLLLFNWRRWSRQHHCCLEISKYR